MNNFTKESIELVVFDYENNNAQAFIECADNHSFVTTGCNLLEKNYKDIYDMMVFVFSKCAEGEDTINLCFWHAVEYAKTVLNKKTVCCDMM